jgi:pentatricopeptide repeat protein
VLTPPPRSYNPLLSVYETLGRSREARLLAQQMHSHGLQPAVTHANWSASAKPVTYVFENAKKTL